MKRLILLMCLLLNLLAFDANAQAKKDYGTKHAESLYKEATQLMNQKKYGDAKVLFERVVATGDMMFIPKAKEQLNFINRVQKKGEKKAPVFSISDESIEFRYLGGYNNVTVNGSESWNVSPKNYNDWCSVEVDRANNRIIVNVAPNESTEEREALLTVTTKSGKKKTIKVKNEGAPTVLRSSASNLVFTPEGETNVVDIDANTEWDIAEVPEWLQAVKGIKDIQFTAAPNDVNKDRIAQVKVETPSDNHITINIIQSAALDSLAFSKNDLHFGPEGGDEYIKVFTDADDWRFGAFPHWCQLTRLDDDTILVHCTPNDPFDLAREASVNVTTGNQTLGINVYQDPKPIVHLIPVDGVGGRRISFGFNVGYLCPMISVKSSSENTFSAVNYAIGNQTEKASFSSSGGFSIGAYADMRLYKNLYLKGGVEFDYYKYKNEFTGNFIFSLPQTNSFYMKGEVKGSFKEDYSMTTVAIPILVSYRIPLAKTQHLQFNVGPVIDFGLSSKLNLSGKTNGEHMKHYKIVNGNRTNELYDHGEYSSHLNYKGSLNMYSDKASIVNTTADGQNGSFSNNDKLDGAPYNRVNCGLRFGVGYEFMGISLSVSYQWMMTNMASKKYWEGDRWTIFRNATELMRGYSQHNNLLLISLGYTFRY